MKERASHIIVSIDQLPGRRLGLPEGLAPEPVQDDPIRTQTIPSFQLCVVFMACYDFVLQLAITKGTRLPISGLSIVCIL